MTDPRELPLDWFRDLQFKKLSSSRNVAKTHWLDMPTKTLYNRLCEEVEELRVAINEHGSPEVIDECVDVANFAAMLAHQATEEVGK